MPPPRVPPPQDSDRRKQEETAQSPSRHRHIEQSQYHVMRLEREFQAHKDGGWPSGERGSRDRDMMNGALPPLETNELLPLREPHREAFRQPSRLSRIPPPPSRSEPFLQRLQRRNYAPPRREELADPRYNSRGFAKTHMDARYYPERGDPRLPLRTISRASYIPQPLGAAPESRSITYPPRDSGYFSNSDIRAQQLFRDEDVSYIEPQTPARAQAAAPPPSGVAQESPFFTRNVTPTAVMRTPALVRTQLQPEQFVSGARHYRMAPASPTEVVGQSLNSLSFINSPYTNRNKPIFSHGASNQLRPFSMAHRRGPDHAAEPGYFSRRDELQPVEDRAEYSRAGLTSRLQYRQASALPSRNGRVFTRDDDMRLLSTIRGAKSGSSAAEYSYGRPVIRKAPPPVVSFARNIMTGTPLISRDGRGTARRV